MSFIVLKISNIENENSTVSNQRHFLKFSFKIENENSILFSKNIFLENENNFLTHPKNTK